MPQVDLAVLKDRVLDVARRSSIGDRLKNVTVEADCYEEGSDFLKIVIDLEALDKIGIDDMMTLLTDVENTIIDMDERFPSIRFADAA